MFIDYVRNIAGATDQTLIGNIGDSLKVLSPDSPSGTTALGALNAVVQTSMQGRASAGFQILSGTLIGTLNAQCSLDGGTTWVNVPFYDPTNSTVFQNLTFSSSNGLKVLSVLPIGGSSDVRVIVSSYTSGTANAVLRASEVNGATGAITAAAFGTVSNSFPAISGNTPTKILNSNSNRKWAMVSNNSGSTVNIQLGSSTGLSANTGIIITAKDKYELKGDNLYTGDIYAYCAGGVTISVSEGTP